MLLDHELKISRARQHLNDLDGQITDWLSGYVCTVRQEYDPDAIASTPGLALPPGPAGYMLGGSVIMPGQSPPSGELEWGRGVISVYIDDVPGNKIPDDFGLLLGDCLHNLRSALDTLAYALTRAGPLRLTDKLERDSEFPIFGDEDARGRTGRGPTMFRDGKRKIAGWKPGAKAVVQGLQPYNRGQSFRDDPLWVLHELDRINKHRFLHTVVAYSIGVGWQPTKTVNLRAIGPGLISPFAGPVERGAPVVRMFGVHPVDPSRKVHVEIAPALDVVFDAKTPAVGEQPVLATLATVFNYVVTDVTGPLEAFL